MKIATSIREGIKEGGDFSCGKTNNSGGAKFIFLLSFLMKVQKKAKTVQTNMVAYVVCVINFKSEVRSDL